MKTYRHTDAHEAATLLVAALWLRIRLLFGYTAMPEWPLDKLIAALLLVPLRVDPIELAENLRIELLAFYWQNNKQPCPLPTVLRRAETIYDRYVSSTGFSQAKQYHTRALIEIALIDTIGQPIDLLLAHDGLLFKRVLDAAQP